MKNRLLFLATAFAILASTQEPAQASAGWLPVSKGETLKMDFCVPKSNMGVLYLRANQLNGPASVLIAKFRTEKFSKDKYCRDEMEYGLKQGFYHFQYSWKVNVIGEWGIALTSLSPKKFYSGWPDGIDAS